MAIISIPFTFSAGAAIIASQHNSCFSTIYSDYNGNITNANISGSAAIAYSKLNLATSIVNADINASAAIVASKLDLTSPGAIGSTAPNTGAFTTLKVGTTNQGDILYDNGTSLTRLTPGTSGQFLKTQGASANPLWASIVTSNVLFQLSANTTLTGSGQGLISGTSLVPSTATGNYSFLSSRDDGSNAYVTVWTTKWIKAANISTVTVYAEIWVRGGSDGTANMKVDIGGANSSVSGTSNQVTPEWNSLSVDVSGLSNGTAYTVTVQIGHSAATTSNAFLGNLISFGS